MSIKDTINSIINEQIRKPEFNAYNIKKFNVKMSDGTSLNTLVSFPDGYNTPLPVILTRSPYGEKSLRFFFEMSLFGYICVYQDCRGCYKSEGEWEPYIHEESDGLDTLNWIISQSWCNKNIAMTGESYLSLTQLVMAHRLPKEVKTLNIEVFSPYRYDLLYSDGMYHLEAYAGWTAYNVKSKLFHDKDKIYNMAITHKPQITLDKNIFGQELNWYKSWLLSSDKNSDLWKKGIWDQLHKSPENINIPVLFRGGWYDPHIEGMMREFKNLKEDIKKQSIFIITPLNHKGTLSSDIQMNNIFDFIGKKFIKTKLMWFDYHLKGIPLPESFQKGNTYYYLMGDNSWHCTKDIFENTDYIKLFFDTSNNKLCRSMPLTDKKSYIYNPDKPSQTLGSDVLMINYIYQKNPPPIHGHRLINTRNGVDCITFQSDDMKNDTIIRGNIESEIFISTNVEDTAFCIKVSDVYPNGDTYHLRENITSIKYNENIVEDYAPGEIVKLKLTLFNIAYKLKKGHKLRVDITSSSFPAFHNHCNTNKSWSKETKSVVATQTIYSGVDFPSFIKIPTDTKNNNY